MYTEKKSLMGIPQAAIQFAFISVGYCSYKGEGLGVGGGWGHFQRQQKSWCSLFVLVPSSMLKKNDKRHPICKIKIFM
jgi:hypothetical protein